MSACWHRQWRCLRAYLAPRSTNVICALRQTRSTVIYVQMHASRSCTDEGPPCTCPLCASDWSSCVPHSEGLQLSRDLGATYLELPSLNNFFVGRYFGSVVSICIASDQTCVPSKNIGLAFGVLLNTLDFNWIMLAAAINKSQGWITDGANGTSVLRYPTVKG